MILTLQAPIKVLVPALNLMEKTATHWTAGNQMHGQATTARA
jgi:hypothetical protein